MSTAALRERLAELDAAIVEQKAVLENLERSLILFESDYCSTVLDVLPHLTLPALQFLCISSLGNRFKSLFLFITRSSPPLRTLSVGARSVVFYKWLDPCFSRVAATLENLEISFPNTEFQGDVLKFGSLLSPYNPLPRLRTLHLIDASGADYKTLVRFLHRRSTTPTLAKIRSFRLTLRHGCVLRDTFSDELGTGTGVRAI
ncbi:hypothetical protein B0H17DRAFT_1217135 [Mycena rosella]|uniref:F-box domain-containing protein n=1 Tax=Mycena rosella TaxID=1033263 RepID=A0AAD7FSX8_MYCRO|nr:hypothetical protein B0H17DRAFT_1217135 [Mycena rosella]